MHRTPAGRPARRLGRRRSADRQRPDRRRLENRRTENPRPEDRWVDDFWPSDRLPTRRAARRAGGNRWSRGLLRPRRLAALTAAFVVLTAGTVLALELRSGPRVAQRAAQPEASAEPANAVTRERPAAAPPVDARPAARATRSAGPSPRPAVRSGAPGGPGCVIRRDLVPVCGAWWGVSPGIDPLARLESTFGRRFDLVHFWHGVDQTRVPSPEALRLARQGRILHINIASRAFGGSGSARWSDVAGGRWDAALARQAKGVAAVGRPVFMTFDHEPDTKPKLRSRGTPAEFVRAWRRVHDIYERNGATNAVWVWVLTGYEGNLPRAAGFYPGNRYVDWIGWENYLSTMCDGRIWPAKRFRSFENTFKPFYDWLKTAGVRAGIDPRKPYMLNGMASVRFTDPKLSVRWYDQIPATLKRYPQIKAVQLWQPPKGMDCPYRLLDRPDEGAAFARAGRSLHLDPLRLARTR